MPATKTHIIESEACSERVRLVFAGTPVAVRAALAETLGRLGPGAGGEADRGALEIVLAEALNNVVEHAYAGRSDGVIELRVGIGCGALDCEILDEGLPMPNDAPPDPALPAVTGPDETLPEGGFGWALIRTFCTGIDYRREGPRNHLRFRLPVAAHA